MKSMLSLFADLGRHADFLLIQRQVPWEDFVNGEKGSSQPRTDIANLITLTKREGLGYVFVVDPLNGLNRREFFGLPLGWEASFGDPKVRSAMMNFALWLVDTYHPRYLGLASEINTYFDAHPGDMPNFLSLYREIYGAVKRRSPETQVFVTFQWEELNNLAPGVREARRPFHIDWNEVEAFEPELDVWAISTYPFVAFQSAADIPPNYYTPLLTRTTKPLAVAEGGYTSRPLGPFHGSPGDQVTYLEKIHGQIGSRLAFWVYLLLSDFDTQAATRALRADGHSSGDARTLSWFSSVGLQNLDGSPKPALKTWDSLRESSMSRQ